jgi:hypothetical protein
VLTGSLRYCRRAEVIVVTDLPEARRTDPWQVGFSDRYEPSNALVRLALSELSGLGVAGRLCWLLIAVQVDVIVWWKRKCTPGLEAAPVGT